MNPGRRYLIFVAIVILNIVLKSIYCNYTPYSYDEIISVKDTLLDFGHIKHEAEWDNNPPFYYYCLWVWHKVLPVNEFNSRLLSVLFISLAIGLVYLFATKWFNQKTALFTALLLTFSNYLTYYAQETRTYSLVVLLAIASSIQLFRYIEKNKNHDLVILSILNFLLIYSHYISGLVIAVQFVTVFILFRDKVKRLFIVNTLVILILVWLRFTKKQFLNILNYNKKEDFWLQTAGIKDLLHTLSELFFNPITAVLFVAVMVFCLIQYRKKRERTITTAIEFYCLLLGFGTILLVFIIGTYKAMFLGRYIIFAVPFATLLVVSTLLKINKSGFYLLGILSVYTIILCKIKKESGMDYKSIANLVSQSKRKNDLVIINKRDNIGLFEYYYDREKFLKYKNIDSLCTSQNIFGVNETGQLQGLQINNGDRIYLVQSFHTINATENTVERYLANKLKTTFSSNNYRGVDFHIYTKTE